MLRASALALLVSVLAPGCYEHRVYLGDAPFSSIGATRACASSMSGTLRDCGWRVDSMRTCVPGASLTVACGSGCGLGSCSGDAMIRLCRGSADCTSSTTIGQNDDSCGDLCPLVETTCPAGGVYTVLTAPYSSSSSASCTIAAR